MRALLLLLLFLLPALTTARQDDTLQLIGDDAETTAVLRNVSRVLPAALGRLRDVPAAPRVPVTDVVSGAEQTIATIPPPIEEDARLLRAAMDRILRVTAQAVPELSDAAAQTAQKARRQIAYLESDHAAENWAAYRTTLRLLGDTIGEFQVLAEYLLLQTGEDSGVEVLPDEWLRGAPTDEEFRRRIAPWSSSRILDECAQRWAIAAQREPPQGLDAQVLVELSELARELANRAVELPPSAQLGFRDTALRLDVQAETLLRLLREENRSHWRRQANQLGQTIEMLRTWLAMQPAE